ncbi:MAG: Gfo/Idh/MocA family oxidoreductase [Verrucomicrobiae bacterium]|nr:Gfo/Idh/MocA family oxidoreductase [Verrucomicrobiae bacterium]
MEKKCADLTPSGIKKLVILGIDHGHWQTVARGAQSRKDVRLTAIAQETPPYADDAAASHGVKSYRNYLECLDVEKPDMVGIAMQHGSRGRWVAEALERGLMVVADKPLCIRSDELKRIEKTLKTTGASLSLMLTERCNPVYEAIEKAVKDGQAGEVVAVEAARYYALNRAARPSWMFDRKTYAGLILDIIIHDYDLARWMTGLAWRGMDGREERSGRYDDRDFNDVAVLSGVEQGKALSLMALWHSPQKHYNRFTVYGTEGCIDLPIGAEAPVLTDQKGNRRPIPLVKGLSFVERVFSALLDGRGALPVSAGEAISLTGELLAAGNK